MKQITKLTLTITLVLTLLLATTTMAFASDRNDPIGGNCASHPIEFGI